MAPDIVLVVSDGQADPDFCHCLYWSKQSQGSSDSMG